MCLFVGVPVFSQRADQSRPCRATQLDAATGVVPRERAHQRGACPCAWSASGLLRAARCWQLRSWPARCERSADVRARPWRAAQLLSRPTAREVDVSELICDICERKRMSRLVHSERARTARVSTGHACEGPRGHAATLCRFTTHIYACCTALRFASAGWPHAEPLSVQRALPFLGRYPPPQLSRSAPRAHPRSFRASIRSISAGVHRVRCRSTAQRVALLVPLSSDTLRQDAVHV